MASSTGREITSSLASYRLQMGALGVLLHQIDLDRVM